MSAFDTLHPAVQHHIVNSLGWRSLRPVQERAIEAHARGANMVILAPTAGGKTEAAFFPVLSQMLTEGWQGLSVLYVSPIRALLNNQEDRLQRYCALVGRRAACWHGDTSPSEKRKLLATPPDCLLTTPESLEVLLVSRRVDHHAFFAHIRAVVIDELHAFAGDDRGWHLLAVFSRIEKMAGRDLQRIGLSATVGNPAEMLDWLSSNSDRPRQVIRPNDPSPVEADVQLDYVGSLPNAAKVIQLLHRGEKRLIFCDSRARVERLALLLRQSGVTTFVSHSSLSLDERRQAEQAFAERRDCVIVATSALELGLDVGDLDRVIQIDAPGSVSSFLQRMGRTGRRSGTRPNCLFLATSEQSLLVAAGLLELWRDGYVEAVQAPPVPYHVLAQQLMALVLQEGGIGRSEWFDWIASVPGFQQTTPELLEEIVDHMLTAGVLWSENGLLAFAPAGETNYGRKNFLDLLAVFTAPPLFRVLSGQKELGYVHESTFYVREQTPPILLLAGRSWLVNRIDWQRRVAYVQPAQERGRSRWLGEGRSMSYRLCQGVRRVLASESVVPYWSRRAITALEELRSQHSWARPNRTSLVMGDEGDLAWWTFGGGIANAQLACELKQRTEVKSTDLHLRFPRSQDVARIEGWLDELSSETIHPVASDAAIEGLKFSECLPPALALAIASVRCDDREAIDSVLTEPRDSWRG